MKKKSPEQKDHELAVSQIAEHLGKSGRSRRVVAASVDRGQDPRRAYRRGAHVHPCPSGPLPGRGIAR